MGEVLKISGFSDEQIEKITPLYDEWCLISLKTMQASAKGMPNLADEYARVKNNLEYELENLIKSLQ